MKTAQMTLALRYALVALAGAVLLAAGLVASDNTPPYDNEAVRQRLVTALGDESLQAPPDGAQPKISRSEASVLAQGRRHSRALESALVWLTGPIPGEFDNKGRLAWAVSQDPDTFGFSCGPAPFGKVKPHECPVAYVGVTFVDALTGEVLFGRARGHVPDEGG
jgi:hypothetical protein